MLQLQVLGALDLRAEGGAEIRAVLRQPKRLALLVYLALEGAGKFVRRDVLLALFWPELDTEHARAALRRAVYFLRKALGPDAITSRGDDELAVGAAAIDCDASRFHEALARGDAAGALGHYRGDLLPGFYVAGAPDAERWLDELRGNLRSRAVAAAWSLADAPGTAPADAVERGRRAARLAGDDEASAVRLMRLLDRAGDMAGALEVYAQLERRLAADEDRPSPETLRLAREIGVRKAKATPPGGEPAMMIVAVLPFTVRGAAALDYAGEGAVELLATALDGLGELRTLTPQALLTTLAAEGERADAARRAAERLGATHVVTGTIVESGGQLRVAAAFETMRGDLVARAESRGAAEGGLFDAFDAIAQQLVGAMVARPATRIAQVAARTTASLPALRAWLLGEKSFRLGRFRDAIAAYDEAVRHDEAFALAWYRLAGSRAAVAEVAAARVASRHAMQHADRLSPHDRLLMEAQDAWLSGHLPEAERRYAAAVVVQPDNLEAWYLLGDALFHAAPYYGRSIREAREPLERAAALDPSHLGALVKLARLASLEGRDADLDALVDRFLRLSPGADQALAVRTLRAFRLRRTMDQAALLNDFRKAGALAVAVAFGDAALYAGAVDEVSGLAGMMVAGIRSAELRALARLMLGGLSLARGRVGAAMTSFDAARADDPRWTLEVEAVLLAAPDLHLDAVRATAVREALAALDPAAAPPNVSAPLDLHNSLHAHLRCYGLGLLAARAGDPAAVAAAVEQLAELDVPGWADALVQRMARTLDALVRRARGDVAGALAAIDGARAEVWYQFAVASPVFCGGRERLLRAELLMDAGRHAEAAGWLAAIGERTPWELPYVPAARRQEARCHEALGDRAAAARCWREVQRWYAGAEGAAAAVADEATEALAALETVGS